MSASFVGSAGVIGWPVAHSKSPAIHRFWLEKLGLDGDYGRFPIHPDALARALGGLPALGLKGVNVTVPHKQAVIPLLSRTDSDAAAIGAVNTIVVEAGDLAGYNSDVMGFAEPLAGIGPGLRRIALIGAGGAARAALAAVKRWPQASLVVLARRPEQARGLLDHFGLTGDIASIDSVALAGADLVINASPLGMTGQPSLPVRLDHAAADATIYDMVYAPLETPLLADARERRLKVIDGLSMLIGQAAWAFSLFYGHRAPREHDVELRERLTA